MLLWQLNLATDDDEEPAPFLALAIVGESVALPRVTEDEIRTGSVVNEVLV